MPVSRALVIDSLVTPVVLATFSAWASVSAAPGVVILAYDREAVEKDAGARMRDSDDSRAAVKKRCIDRLSLINNKSSTLPLATLWLLRVAPVWLSIVAIQVIGGSVAYELRGGSGGKRHFS